MSRLEETAARVLAPFILGTPGRLQSVDQPAIAAWAQKTVLVAMLLSPEADRARGYGLPPPEYTQLYGQRDAMEPLPASQFWIGRYIGVRDWSVRGTPVIVAGKGLPEPDGPQGYVMTIILGQLVIEGFRFTTAALAVPLSPLRGLARIWPVEEAVDWPTGAPLDDEAFHRFVRGEELRPHESFVAVRPWKTATELEPSQLIGSMIELPTACGKLVVYYPAALAADAQRGQFYAFVSSCECGTAYLIHTEPDGAHLKMAGTVEPIEMAYKATPGDEYEFGDEHGRFFCKLIAE
jgi:hypothetical protein